MRVLVCGGRDYSRAWVASWLARHLKEEVAFALRCSAFSISAVIHGGARGADQGAADYAKSADIKQVVFPADWELHGKAAGPIRNQRMIDEGKPDVVVAFPGGRGTADMVRRARAASIEVIEVKE
jgi:hypothetical protein